MKTSQRKMNSRGSATGREIRMEVIAQEIFNAWKKDEKEDFFENNVKTAQKTAEDIDDAQSPMNGEFLDSSVDAGSIISGASCSSADGINVEDFAEFEDDEEHDFPDQSSSCAGLHLHDTEDMTTYYSSPSGTSSSRRRSGRSSIHDSQQGSSKGSSSTINCSDTKSQTDATELSIEEIQKCVVEHIPQALKDLLPQEVWSQIFRDAIRANYALKNKSPPSTGLPLLDNLTADGDLKDKFDVDGDDLSVLSDITEDSSFFFKSLQVKIAPLVPEEEKWGSGINPPAFGGPSKVESTHSGRSLNLFNDNRSNAARTSRASTNHTRRSRMSVASELNKAGNVIPTKVSFHVVQVRYYERILDLNPSVATGGPAVGIGWRFKNGGQVTVDEWELQRGETRKSASYVLPRNVREAMLKEAGYTPKDIADGVRLVMKAKNQRRTTFSNLHASGLEETVENAARRVKGLLCQRTADVWQE
jgi:hypothetical protein